MLLGALDVGQSASCPVLDPQALPTPLLEGQHEIRQGGQLVLTPAFDVLGTPTTTHGLRRARHDRSDMPSVVIDGGVTRQPSGRAARMSSQARWRGSVVMAGR